MNALEKLKGFTSGGSTREITINDDNGEPQVFLIRKFNSGTDCVNYSKKIQNRIEAVEKSGTSLDVFIPSEVVATYPEQFQDAVQCKDAKHDGKSTIKLSTKEEAAMATTLELGIVEPEMDWPTAVIYTRLNFRLCGTLASEINKTNGEYAIEEAKNDCGEIHSTD